MDSQAKETLAAQFGAALEMLERAIRACPEAAWDDARQVPHTRFWYIASHVLFWLDLYLSERAEGFRPPAPFGLEELDPEGVLPPRTYAPAELLAYLEHGRRKCRARIATLDAASARAKFPVGRAELAVDELMLYNLRHVQHHVGQLQLLLRQAGAEPPRWVGRSAS